METVNEDKVCGQMSQTLLGFEVFRNKNQPQINAENADQNIKKLEFRNWNFNWNLEFMSVAAIVSPFVNSKFY